MEEPVVHESTMSSELPLLFLGLAGFTPEQRERLQQLLGLLPPGDAVWRVGPFAEADAWLVSGEKSRLVAADTLKILAGLPTERTLQLDLDAVDRPIAFSLPLSSDDFLPKHTFDLRVAASLAAVLRHFEGWLRPLRSQFVLGGQLVARENELLPGIYHVSHKGQLLAVMDFHEWRIGMLRKADPVDFERALWDRRPLEAHDIPNHFLRSNLTHLRWIYAQRTERDVLPPRYRSRPVYFRQAPAVPMRWIRDSQLILLRELSQAAGDFEALLQRTGLTHAQLTRDLASLYFAGSVTTTPDKAGTAGTKDGYDSLPGRSSNAQAPGAPAGPPTLPVPRHDLTAPAQLGRQ